MVATGETPPSSLTTAFNMFTFLKALSVLQYSGSIDSGGGLLDSPKVLPIPEMIAEHIKHFLAVFPEESDSSVIIKRLYPFHLFNLDNAQYHALESMLDSFRLSTTTAGKDVDGLTDSLQVSPPTASEDSPSCLHYHFSGVRTTTSTQHDTTTMAVLFETKEGVNEGLPPLVVPTVGGSHLPSTATTVTRGGWESMKLVGAQWEVLTGMMQSHCLGHDICLVGE